MDVFRGNLQPAGFGYDVLVAAAMTATAFGLRIVIEQLFIGIVPFPLVFPAIAAAVLLAGPRAGLMTLIASQALIWYFLVPERQSLGFAAAGDAVSFVLATAAQFVLLWAMSAYRHSATRAAALERERTQHLEVALRELDHRTKNNFSLAAGLLRMQGRRSSAPVREEFDTAARRLLSLEAAHANLAVLGGDITEVSLGDYLLHLCTRIRDGSAPDGVTIACNVPEMRFPRHRAVSLGLVINELIANSLKHAFPDGAGHIDVDAAFDGRTLSVCVADDGVGLGNPRNSSPLGLELVDLLLRDLGATLSHEPGKGARFRIELAHEEARAA